MEPFVNEICDTEIENEIRNLNKPIQCGICGENHSLKECNILKVTNHIPDRIIPSKARLTLPDSMEIRTLSDCTYNVYAQSLIEMGTQFGPFQAKKLFTLHPSIDFPLKIFTNADEDLSEYFLDTSDENECSWMIFISPASDFEEQNVICYQEGENLYYGTVKDIYPGEPLKVWYSPYYATKMKKALLSPSVVEENIVARPVDVEALLKRNKNIMPRDLWSCKFCGKVEKELSVFAFHLLDHYRAQLRRVCTICKESFLSRRLLNKHMRFVHGNNLTKTTDSVEDAQVIVLNVKDKNDSKDTSVGGPLLLNNITSDSLDNSSLLLPQTDLSQFDLSGIENQNMLLENENLNLNVDNILNDNVKQLDHFNFEINEPETEQLICDICLKNFIKLKSLIQHMEQHTGKYLCYECNRVFARKENLVHHSCRSFYKVKCPLCVRIFFQKKYLTQHIKAIHNKQFTCENCHKLYDCKKNLETHNCPNVPIIKKEKFPCSICSKIFFKKRDLNAHVQRHTKKQSTQQFICAVCNKILNSRKIYLKHAKLHEGESYPCDVCDKVFTRKDGLKAHKEQCHSEQKKMETCEICKKTVKCKKHLKVHMETHRKDKPYKCQICPAEFKCRTNLKKHTNKHTSPRNKFESLFQENIEFYYCPKCNKNMKLKSSLRRHMRSFHPDHEVASETMKPIIGKLIGKKLHDDYNIKDDVLQHDIEEDESVMDLKQTIENMNFNTDEVNNCSENNDINIEIDNILNNTDNLDNFLSESSDRIVETLINIAAKENQLNSVNNHYIPKEVCLSMPDLTDSDQEIKLGENAYILDNGTIVEPQESSSKVVLYILDQDKFT